MKKIKEITFSTTRERATISILTGGDGSDIKEFIRKRHGDVKLWSWGKEVNIDDALTTDGFSFHIDAILGQGERFYAWFHKPESYMVWHELDHLRNDIMYHRGAVFGEGSEEPYVYLGSEIFEKYINGGGKII